MVPPSFVGNLQDSASLRREVLGAKGGLLFGGGVCFFDRFWPMKQKEIFGPQGKLALALACGPIRIVWNPLRYDLRSF